MHFFYENKGGEVMILYSNRLECEAHLHYHLEIVFMLEGKSAAYIDGMKYEFEAGDALFIFPNQIHHYITSEKEGYVLCVFPPDMCSEFKHIFKKKVPEDPVIKGIGRDEKTAALFRDLVAYKQEESKYQEMLIRGGFLLAVTRLFERMKFEPVKSSDSDTIKDLLNYCMANYTQDISLETAAEALHISKYYISHLFTKKLHIGFHEYISTLRISEACRMLSELELSITDIAYAAGFNSTRSFNRAFIKHTNMTPSEYKMRSVK